MSWFDPKELPIITNSVELEEAMGIVKSRFNGHPHKFTRNDYLLLINTLYAALQAAYNSAGNTVSAELSQSLDADYPLEVGYVKDTAYYPIGTKLEDIIKDMLVGNPATQQLQAPAITSSSGSNYFNPTTTITITTTESNCDIYYSLDSDHGWRIYNGQFDINQTTTIKAKVVPNYRSGYLWTESPETTVTYSLHIRQKLQDPIIVIQNQYDKCDVMISASAVDNAPSDCKVQYSDDNTQTWHDYTKGTLLQYNSLNDTPIIYAQVIDINGKYLDSNIVSDQVRYHTLPNPSVTFKDSTHFVGQYNSDGVFNYWGEVILDKAEHNPAIQYLSPDFEWDGSTNTPTQFVNPVTLKSKILMADGQTYNTSPGLTITFNRNYYTLRSPLITGTDQFTNQSVISVAKNQGIQGRNDDADECVDLTWTIDGVPQTGTTATITDTATIEATITIKSGYEKYYSTNTPTKVTKTFHKKKPLIIYSSMLDPVGQTYNTQSGYDDLGNPIINTISINQIGDSFDVNSFDSNVKFDTNNHKHLISSGYCVKSSKDTNPSIYTSEKLDISKLIIQEKNPQSTNWSGDTQNTTNLAILLELQVGQQTINGESYYVYSLNVNHSSTCLYKLQYGTN